MLHEKLYIFFLSLTPGLLRCLDGPEVKALNIALLCFSITSCDAIFECLTILSLLLLGKHPKILYHPQNWRHTKRSGRQTVNKSCTCALKAIRQDAPRGANDGWLDCGQDLFYPLSTIQRKKPSYLFKSHPLFLKSNWASSCRKVFSVLALTYKKGRVNS